MAKGPHRREKLSAVAAARLARTGNRTKVCDGGGLWLYVTSPTAASWVFRYHMGGVDREAGLGKFADMSLATARAIASDMRRQKALGKDPLEERSRSQVVPFRACAEQYIESQAAGWRGARTAEFWRQSLSDYAFPILGNLSVADIDASTVRRALVPIWLSKPETGRKLRAQIERVIEFAIANNHRTAVNPATGKKLRHLLPPQTDRVEHRPALPVAEVAAFLQALRDKPGIAARALEFTILTAARTGEVIGARWDEIDFAAKVWTVPASRMKSGRVHRVPLSDAALAVLEALRPARAVQPYVFPSVKPGKPIGDAAMRKLLLRLGWGSFTVHGFRSTFRDWAAEAGYSRDLAESALAHATGNAVEQAYNRSDLFERRRQLMQDWAAFCSS